MRVDYRPFNSALPLQSASLVGARLSRAGEDPKTQDDPKTENKKNIRPQTADVALRGAQDALGMVRTADASLGAIERIVGQMRDLTMIAASDTSTYEDRRTIQQELDRYAQDVDRIARTAKFGGKSLLDGTSAAVWSSDRLSTRAVIGGAIRRANGSSAQGNYKITVDLLKPGVGETQSTRTFRVKVAAVEGGGTAGPVEPGGQVSGSIRAYNMPKGDFTLNIFPNDDVGSGWGEDARAKVLFAAGGYGLYAEEGTRELSGLITDYYGNKAYEEKYAATGWPDSDIDTRKIFRTGGVDTLSLDDGTRMNVQLYLVAEEVDVDANTVTFDVQARGLTEYGENVDYAGMKLIATSDGLAAGALADIGLVVQDGFMSLEPGEAARFRVGDSFVISMAAPGKDLESIMVMGDLDMTWEDSWDYPIYWKSERYRFFGTAYAIRPEAAADSLIVFRGFYLNHDDGTIYDGELHVQFGPDMYLNKRHVEFGIEFAGEFLPMSDYDYDVIAEFRSEYVAPPEADPDIYDGLFEELGLSADVTLTISLGSGEWINVTIGKNDTMGDIADKLNSAVADLVDRRGYNSESFGGRFVEIVRDERYGSEELSDGTIVMYGRFEFRSPLPGADGRIIVAGPDEFMNDIDLAVVRAAEDSRFVLAAYDAHTGISRAEDVKVTGSTAVGLLHDRVDVKFDPLADTDVRWSADGREFKLRRADGTYTTYVHLADRTTAFAAGEPVSGDTIYDIGSAEADALGLDRLIVTTRREAAATLTRLDRALERISVMRARLGAEDSRMSSVATLAASKVDTDRPTLDTRGAEQMLALVRQSIASSADRALHSSATLSPDRVVALAQMARRTAA